MVTKMYILNNWQEVLLTIWETIVSWFESRLSQQTLPNQTKLSLNILNNLIIDRLYIQSIWSFFMMCQVFKILYNKMYCILLYNMV